MIRSVDEVRFALDIDEDLLQAVEELAALRRTTAGKVLSELVRRGLHPRRDSTSERNGVPVLPPRAGEAFVTAELVNRLRDED